MMLSMSLLWKGQLRARNPIRLIVLRADPELRFILQPRSQFRQLGRTVDESIPQALRGLKPFAARAFKKPLRTLQGRFQPLKFSSQSFDIRPGILDSGGVMEAKRCDFRRQLDQSDDARCGSHCLHGVTISNGLSSSEVSIYTGLTKRRSQMRGNVELSSVP
jgi:hypothetical protein